MSVVRIDTRLPDVDMADVRMGVLLQACILSPSLVSGVFLQKRLVYSILHFILLEFI